MWPSTERGGKGKHFVRDNKSGARKKGGGGKGSLPRTGRGTVGTKREGCQARGEKTRERKGVHNAKGALKGGEGEGRKY